MRPHSKTLETGIAGPRWIVGSRSLDASFLDRARARLVDEMALTSTDVLLAAGESVPGLVAALAAADRTGCEVILAPAGVSPDSLSALCRCTVDLSNAGRARRLSPSAAPEAGRGTGATVCLLTSGTTGSPKMVRHTLDQLRLGMQAGPETTAASWLLTYPVTGFAGLQVLLTAWVGQATLVVPETRSVSGMVASAIEHQVTHASGTPTFWRSFLLALPDSEKLPPLRSITLGGEAVDQRLLDRLRARFPTARIVQIYASTEAGVIFSVRDDRAGFPADWLDAPPGSARLRIREDELEVLSPRGMLGYASDHASPVDGEGWIRTGDVVRIQGDRVIFAGRTDTRINIGGYKVGPEDVEAAILAVDGVADARVFGQASRLSGQVLIAEIAPEPGRSPEEVRQAVAAHLHGAGAPLQPYQVPRILRIVERLAASVSGKKPRSPLHAKPAAEREH